jgi:hypothetical protein
MARIKEAVQARGFERVQVWERVGRSKRGKIRYRYVGNSGWIKNTITDDGRTAYLAATVGGLGGGKIPSHLQMATQTAVVNATQTLLDGATRVRKALVATTLATGTLRMVASWSSTDNGAAVTIGAVGVHNHVSTGTMGSGQTFATSQWNSNQDLSVTYEWRF